MDTSLRGEELRHRVLPTRPVTARTSPSQDIAETDEGLTVASTMDTEMAAPDPGPDRRAGHAGDLRRDSRRHQGIDVSRPAGQSVGLQRTSVGVERTSLGQALSGCGADVLDAEGVSVAEAPHRFQVSPADPLSDRGGTDADEVSGLTGEDDLAGRVAH